MVDASGVACWVISMGHSGSWSSGLFPQNRAATAALCWQQIAPHSTLHMVPLEVLWNVTWRHHSTLYQHILELYLYFKLLKR